MGVATSRGCPDHPLPPVLLKRWDSSSIHPFIAQIVTPTVGRELGWALIAKLPKLSDIQAGKPDACSDEGQAAQSPGRTWAQVPSQSPLEPAWLR